jgi:hypothetical protein
MNILVFVSLAVNYRNAYSTTTSGVYILTYVEQTIERPAIEYVLSFPWRDND